MRQASAERRVLSSTARRTREKPRALREICFDCRSDSSIQKTSSRTFFRRSVRNLGGLKRRMQRNKFRYYQTLRETPASPQEQKVHDFGNVARYFVSRVSIWNPLSASSDGMSNVR